MMSQLNLDLAQALVRDRLQQAANDALAHEASALKPALRPRFAQTLRDLAVRLDPTLACEPCLPVVAAMRSR
jgi:hypothetical protein